MKTYAQLEREVEQLTNTLAEAVSDAATWKRRALEKEKPTRVLAEELATARADLAAITPLKNKDIRLVIELSKENIAAKNALNAVLLWHGAPVWTQEVKDQWDKLTGNSETSTKAMCDFIRNTLVNEKPITTHAEVPGSEGQETQE